jgi:hypothetical protein
MSRRVRFSVVVVAVLAGMFVTGYTVAAQLSPSLVPAGTVRYGVASASSDVTSTSTTYVNIPAMHVGFVVPPHQHADVIITFSGEVNSCTPIEARAVVDGVAASPSETQLFYPDGIGAQSHGFTFYTESLPAGTHNVFIQWHGLSTCNQQFISNRSLVVTVNDHA